MANDSTARPPENRSLAPAPGSAWAHATGVLPWRDAPLVMGILNVTPDSFSDGGRFLDPEAAAGHAIILDRAGADLIDVGGESTRPGAASVDPDEEIRRVVPVIERLRDRIGTPISVDTTKAEVARCAVAAGAAIVNDISAGRSDPDILRVAADTGAGLVLMHMQGSPRTMQENPHYDDVVAEVVRFLHDRAAAAVDAGVPADRIALDPGIGFGKTVEHNLALLRGLDRIVELGLPVVVGTSRKSFIGRVLDLEVDDRSWGTAATVAIAVARGAAVVRVHDVAPMAQVVRMTHAILTAG